MTVIAPVDPSIDLGAFCREHYGLKGARVRRVLAGGMFAKPLLVATNDGDFVLRTHRIRSTPETFRFQAESIHAASRGGVLCPEVLRTTAGDWCVTTATDGAVYALHAYSEGVVVDWNEWLARCRRRDGFLPALAMAVASLHNQLAVAEPGGEAHLDIREPPIRFDRLAAVHDAWRSALTGPGLLDSARRGCLATTTLLRLADQISTHWRWLIEESERLDLADLPEQVVHGDISPVNLVWNDEGQPAFIDWDVTHRGKRLYDALGDVLNRYPDGQPDQNRFSVDNVAEYLAGYDSALSRPLSRQEVRAVPAFCLARQLEDLRQRAATLPSLAREKRVQYARLITMRVEIMDQIRAADFTPVLGPC